MEIWLSEREAVEMNVGRRRNSRRRLVGTISQLRGRKNGREGLEYQEGKIKEGNREQRPQQECYKHYQQQYSACSVTSQKPTSKKSSQLLAEILYTILLSCQAFVSLGQQLILKVTSAVQILRIVLDRSLADAMSQKLQAPDRYEALDEMPDAAAAAPTPIHSPSPDPPPPPPTHVIAEPTGRRYLSPMPYPGAPGAPYFSGNNVTEFLQRFQLTCKEYDVQNEGMFQKLPWYCEKIIGDYVKSILEYISRDGPGLFKIMRKDYRKYDLD